MWDFDGDGAWDTGWQSQPTARHQYAKKQSYKVRLRVRDKRWKRIESGTKTLEVR
jgi:PKD repeat protein